MPPTDAALRKRKSREKKKAELGLDEYRRQEASYRKDFRKSRTVSPDTKKKEADQNRKRVSRSRSKAKAKEVTPQEGLKTYPRSTLMRSVKKAESALPQTPRRRSRVLKHLFEKHSPAMEVSKRTEKKGGHSGAKERKVVVEKFFERDDISYQAPGIKDVMTVRIDSKRKKVQKRYLRYTIKEAYDIYKAENPENAVKVARFYYLKPAHVLLRGDTPASVCLCEYHENMKMLVAAIPWLPNTLGDFVDLVVCDRQAEDCMFQVCTACKDLKLFESLVEAHLKSGSSARNIKYDQWAKPEGERLKLRSYEAPMEDVINVLKGQLVYFLSHTFIKRKQADFWHGKIESPEKGTVFIQMDFSENYVHFTQDEVQSAYFDQESSTLFTMMLYFEENSIAMKEPYVIITDFKGYQGSKGHDKFAVSYFTTVAIKDFLARHKDFDLKKIEFLSDGTAQHFKQKYSLCQVLTLNFPQYKVLWHFSPTSHGKGPIDGIGGSIKRLVTAKLKGLRGSVKDSRHFAELAQDVCPNVFVKYVSSEKTIQFISDKMLVESWKDLKTLPQTQVQHYFEGEGVYKVSYNRYSSREVGKKTHVFKNPTQPDPEPTEPDPEPSQPEAPSVSDETDSCIVRLQDPTTSKELSISDREWAVVTLEEKATYIVQVICKDTSESYKVDYYSSLPLTANQIFRKCTAWKEDYLVGQNEFVEILERPELLPGSKVKFAAGRLSKYRFK